MVLTARVSQSFRTLNILSQPQRDANGRLASARFNADANGPPVGRLHRFTSRLRRLREA